MKPNISVLLKKLRGNTDKTQRDVAEFLGISRQAYSRYESNLREPDMETLAKIAEYFNVSPQIFYLDDIDKMIDPKMDIMEMIARYQVKKLLGIESSDDDTSGLQKYIKKQDLEQIQTKLSDEFELSTATEEQSKTTPLKRRIIKYGFIFLIVLFMVNIGFMSLHRFDPDYKYQILNHSYINAITPDQNVNQTMYLDIVRVTEFQPTDIQIGDYIVIYDDFGLSEYFVEQVTAVDMDNQTVSTTYDQTTVISNRFVDVIGKYETEANLLGTIYYASKFETGYLFLILGHFILLAMYYLTFIDVKNK